MKERIRPVQAQPIRERQVLWVLFTAYMAILCYLLFFEKALGRSETHRGYAYNLVLFQEIRRFVQYRKQLGTRAVLVNLVGNVCCFIPFGIFLYCGCPKLRHIAAIAALTCLFSLLVETVQLVFQVGCFDVDDILLNTIGGFWGAVGMTIQSRFGSGKKICRTAARILQTPPLCWRKKSESRQMHGHRSGK